MRILFVFAGIAAGIALLYKWRCRLLVVFLAFGLLRQMTPIVTRNMSSIKKTLLPILFNKQETGVDN